MKRSIVNMLLACVAFLVFALIVASVIKTRIKILLRRIGRAGRRVYRNLRPGRLQG